MQNAPQTRRTPWFKGLLAGTLITGAAQAAELPDPVPLHYLNIQTIQPQTRAAFVASMRNNALQSRKEAANIVFDVGDLGGNDPTLVLFESWRDRAGYLQHEGSAHVAPVIALVPTGFARPERKYLLQNVVDLPAPARKAIDQPSETRNVVALVKIKAAQRQAFIDGVRPVIEQSRQAQGNLVFDVYQQHNDANTFVIYQRWTDAKAYQRQRLTAYTNAFSAQLNTWVDGAPEVLDLKDRIEK